MSEQKNTPLRVIIGNPPYSIGQKSANDNAQNQSYPKLEARIAETYVAGSAASLSKSAYDSYIKAFRWATDRLDKKNGGVVAFITNSGWIDSNGLDGFRKCIEHEFSSLYVFNLKGAIRGRSGDAAKREGQNVFNIMTGVAITLLVKNPSARGEKAVINYYNVDDYLNRKEKLNLLTNSKSFFNDTLKKELIVPNEHGDWINLRKDSFEAFIPLEPGKKFDGKTQSFFSTYAIGVSTNRDAWVYNFSEDSLKENMRKMIGFYNEQRKGFAEKKNRKLSVEDFIDTDPEKISWSVNLKNDIARGEVHHFHKDKCCMAMYRPFTKQWLYYDKYMIERPGLWSQFFPTEVHDNLIICLSCVGTSKGLSAFICEEISDLHFIGDTQCYPLYYYEEKTASQGNLFDKSKSNGGYVRRDAVSDFILTQARTQYGPKVSKEDIFYYVYGLLHSPTYRAVFANDLKKSLPRLPLVEKSADFWSFSKAGRALADIHLNYESQPALSGVLVNGKPVAKSRFSADRLVVNQMKFPAKGQRDVIVYNSHIKISGIPAAAYEYVVNGKSAIEWVMERYAVTVHKASGIGNDPNDWAAERGDPRYVLDMLLSVIAVSVKTVDIVAALPALVFEESASAPVGRR